MEQIELKSWEDANSIELQNSLETSGKSGARGIISKIERKLIVKRWRATIPPKTAGVYQIKNKVNGRYYIGSARDIVNRFLTHLSKLINNACHNRRIQNDWNKYSYRNFEFSVIEVCEQNIMMDIEQRYLDIGFRNPKIFYNHKPVAKSGVTGRYSLDLRRKMSLVQKRNENKYNFYNIATKESVFCSIFDLIDKYPNLNRKTLNKLVKGHCDSYICWILKDNLETVFNNSTKQGKTMNALIKRYEELKNPKIYNFYNLKTKEEFVGSKFDFINKYYKNGFSTKVNRLISYSCLHATFWVLKERLKEVLSGKTFASNYLLTVLNK